MTAPTLDVSFRLNGGAVTVAVAPDTRLSAILRDPFGLTAAKVGCSIGRCGACMVLMNGKIANACLLMAWQLHGADIRSPEGLRDSPVAPILQSALAEENAFQCGYCAPGIVVALTALLTTTPDAGREEILTALEGNICRCTGYHSIIRGALGAVAALKTAGLAAGPEGKTP